MNPTDEKEREDSLNPAAQQQKQLTNRTYGGDKKALAEQKYGRYAQAPGLGDLANKERNPAAPSSQKMSPSMGSGGAGGGNLWSGKGSKKEEEADQGAGSQFASFVQRRKKAIVAILVAAVIGVAGIGVMTLFPNLQAKILANAIEHLTSKLVRVAIQKRIGRYLDSYLERVALNGVKACGDSRNIDCMKSHAFTGEWPKGKVGKMMQAWDKDMSLIQMFNLNGNYITYEGGNFTMNTRKGKYDIPEGDVGGGKLRMTKYIKKEYSLASALFRDLEISSFYDFSISRLIARHVVEWTGLPMCNFGCDKKKLEEFKKLPDTKKKSKVTEVVKGLIRARIINPLKHMGALEVRCLLRVVKCEEEDTVEEELKSTYKDISDEHRSTERDIDSLEKQGLDLKPDEIKKSGMMKLGIEKLSARILSTEGTMGIPGLNFIVMLAKIADTIAAFIQIITAEQGSAASFSNGFQANRSLQILANGIRIIQAMGATQYLTTGGAENSALENLNDGTIAETYGKKLEGFQASEVFLRTWGTLSSRKKDEIPYSEVCNDGKVIPQDSVHPVCRNFDLSRMPAINEWFAAHPVIANILGAMVSLIRDNPILRALLFILELIDDVVSIIFELLPIISQIAELLMKLLGFEQLIQWAIEFLAPVINEALGPLFATQEQVHGPGLFNAVVMGRDVGNYRYARDKLGGRELTDEEAKKQSVAAAHEEKLDRDYASVTERLFSFEDSYSLVSQLVMNGPFTDVSSPQKFLAALNPFSLFSILLRLPHAYAYSSDYDLPSNRFGVPNSSVPMDDDAIERDPWTNAVAEGECKDTRVPQTYTGADGEERKLRNAIGDVWYQTVEPCMIDEETTTIGAAAFSDEVLLPTNFSEDTDDSGDNESSDAENPNPDGTSPPTDTQ